MLDESLTNEYGACLSATELAEFLKLDPRTVIKYADRWGGVEVAPGSWRFFEKRIMEVLNAEHNNEKRNVSLPRQCNSSRSNETKDISGQFTKVKKGSLSLGRANQKGTERDTVPDKYNVFGSR
ncbi:MAG: hypothetical protein ABSF13_07585 [Smithella sp.]|jgi:hypothetical protein